MDSEWHIRRQIVEFSKRIYDKGYVAATDGNVSHRLTGDRVLVTPSGSCLGELQPNDLVCVSLAGHSASGPRKPTSELALHLSVYGIRPDVNAVVHAHPPIANAFSFAGQTLDQCVIPEVVQGFGVIPTTEYATPSSEESARVVRELVKEYDALLLQRHGSVTVGPNLREAFFKLDKLEHAARITLAARQLGAVIPLSTDELRRLGAVRERLGLGSAQDIYTACALRNPQPAQR
jgi:L-fuculose-phosphate aldolase